MIQTSIISLWSNCLIPRVAILFYYYCLCIHTVRRDAPKIASHPMYRPFSFTNLCLCVILRINSFRHLAYMYNSICLCLNDFKISTKLRRKKYSGTIQINMPQESKKYTFLFNQSKRLTS